MIKTMYGQPDKYTLCICLSTHRKYRTFFLLFMCYWFVEVKIRNKGKIDQATHHEVINEDEKPSQSRTRYISTWVAVVVVVDCCINCLCWSRLNLWRHNIVSVFSNVFLFDISVTTSHVPITNSKMTRHNLRINIDWTLIIFHFFLTPTLKLGRGTNEITNITSSFDMVKICVSKLFIPRGWIT